LKTMLKVLKAILKKLDNYKNFTVNFKKSRNPQFSTLKNYVENNKSLNNNLYKINVNTKN